MEQIGSVYEAMMGFALQQAAGPSIACAPKHVVFDVVELLEQKPKDRAAWLQKQAELKVTGDAIGKAASVDDVLAALGKKVSRYTPHVLPPGAMYLQPTEERRRSGSHYTPRSLTAPIVLTTFRPIFERLGDQATPEQILDLKVCDPAMGSGAFLVEACRLLAERLVRAWEVHKQTPKVPDDEDVVTFARRLVAERCLYGVDKNIFAVDLAKLSLWLATLAREHPFTFLDHALRHGDSLVGLSREQIACFNWETTKQMPLLRTLIDGRVAEAQAMRERIQSLATSDDVPEKARLLKEANDALHDVRHIGDLVVSAFFERDKPKDRQTLRAAYAGQVERWLMQRGSGTAVAPDFSPAVSTFHWEIEYPEVFTRPNGGFDVFVGNPPFAGRTTASRSVGTIYWEWLLLMFEDSHGNSDLVAFFFRRCFGLLRHGGNQGLIATNTVRQGDTRRTGLRWITQHAGYIYAAERRIRWPGRAAVVVCSVHLQKAKVPTWCSLDGERVDRITAFLFRYGTSEDPATLKENKGLSFLGSVVVGLGFIFDDRKANQGTHSTELALDLIRRNPKNGDVIRPYLGGDEFADSPTHTPTRFVINFGDRSLEQAQHWPEVLSLVEKTVKHTREVALKQWSADKARRAERWWLHARPARELYAATARLDRVLACAQTSKYTAFGFAANGQVYDQKLIVFALSGPGTFAAMQSRVHENWVQFFGSTMKDDPVYTPSDCFETFPFPERWKSNEDLERTGRQYYDFRAALMVRNSEGLTKTYNRFHDPDERDPDILKLRDLHAAMDRAVLDAYGWTDIQPHCEFILDYEDEADDTPGQPSRRKKPWRYRWPDEIRDEVLGRLLELNAQRAKEEALSGCLGGRKGMRQSKRPADTPLLG